MKGAVRAVRPHRPGPRRSSTPRVVGDPRGQPAARSVRWLPERIEGFEDLLVPLLEHSAQSRRDLAGARRGGAPLPARARAPRTRRIGRDRRASRAGRRSCSRRRSARARTIWSHDVHVPHRRRGRTRAADLDRELRETLERYGLQGRVDLVVARLGRDRYKPSPRAVDLILIDGDHGYTPCEPTGSTGARDLARRRATSSSTTRHDHGGLGTYVPDVGALRAELRDGTPPSSGRRTPAASPTSPTGRRPPHRPPR